MPKVSKESATQGGDYGAVLDRFEELEGYTLSFVSFREDIDATPLYKGLPDDRCQCHHWGYVLTGAVTFRYADGEEQIIAGEASTSRRGTCPSSTHPARSSSCSARPTSWPSPRRRWSGT